MTGRSQTTLFAGSASPLAEEWSLAPEGAAIHRESRTAVIADVHLGYEWSRGWGGDCLPAHSLAETLAKLERLRKRALISRLVVAGDLVESSAPCRQTEQDVRALVEWLALRQVELVALRGNHDESDSTGSDLSETFEIGGWTVAHGDKPVKARKRILGHHHPALRVGRHVAPCFLVGADLIVLPAFSANAAGLNVREGALPRSLGVGPLRRLAFAGEQLLDFGAMAERRPRGR
jgi:putative SbcD/Mre11-related phosphoesterase